MNYWDYIRVEDLLRLQGGIRDEEEKLSNDEVLFIVVHQVYELWFKLILRELTSVRDLFAMNPVPDMALSGAVRGLRRVTTIFEQAAAHFRVMETLTTRDYLGFRDGLIPASGFQSAQMREIEILLGLPDEKRIPLGAESSYKEALKTSDGKASVALDRVERRIADGPSLSSVVRAWLSRTPVSDEGPGPFLDRTLEAIRAETEKRYVMACERMQATGDEAARLRARYDAELALAEAFLRGEDDPERSTEARDEVRHVRAALLFIESYRDLPRLAWPREVIDALITMEQAMLIWRQRHARMVERVIGRRVGTGGSSGVDYLDQTAIRYRVFADVWAVRTLLLRKDAIPTIDNADNFRFKVEDYA